MERTRQCGGSPAHRLLLSAGRQPNLRTGLGQNLVLRHLHYGPSSSCGYPRNCAPSFESVAGLASADDDVVDGDEDNLHEVADEAHHREAERARRRDFLELLRIRLRATCDESLGVLREVVEAHNNHANGIVLVLEEL